MALHLAVCVVFVLRRSVDPLANRLLAALLVVIIGMMTPQMLGFAGFYDAFPWLTFWPFANALAAGPLVYAYVLALTEKRLPRHFVLLLAPAILEFVYSLYWCFRPVADRWAFTDAVHDPWIVPVLNMLQLLLTCGGLLAALYQYRRYRAWLPEHSSATADFDPRWVPVSLAILAAPALVSGGYDLADLVFGPLDYFERFPLFLVLAAGAYALSLGALLQPRVAFPSAAAADDKRKPEPEPAQDWSVEADRVRTELIARGWHLEPRLSLGELAQRLGESEPHVSRAINQGAGVNFNRFVNEVRVEAAKERLALGAEDVLAAALDCGFNSKATFNRVFREIVGMTPSAFRRAAVTSA
ncbi:MAG: AraC family transcriptional regulator [Pseudomonadota bacterium]